MFGKKIAAGVVLLAATATVALTATVAGAAPAPAGSLGSLTITPATGLDISAPTVKTSAGCPTTADGYNLTVTGPGGWAKGLTAAGTSAANLSYTAGFSIPFANTFADIAKIAGTTVTAGQYNISANCVDSLTGTVKGNFTGAVYFTTATAWQTTDPNAPVTTTAALSASPAGPVTQGASTTLTATITPATATGTVQFMDGAATLGSPVTVANGTAAFTTTALAVGSHSLTAVFTGSATNITGSTSPAVTYVVNAPVAATTTTALSVTPSGSAAQYSTVTLNGSVTPAAAAGAIQFTDNGTNLGSPVPLTAGAASLSTSTLSVGAHSFVANFVPANSGAYAPSASGALPLTITAFAGVTTSENITTTVNPGALVISVANANVVLPAPVMLPDGSLLTTAGSLNPITVTDTRAGNPGWTCSGQLANFSDGQSHAINSGNFGWTPKIVDQAAGQKVTAGAQVAPAVGIAPGAAAPAGLGLATSRTLATAAALGGNGTAHLGADVALNVPTSTVAGTYTAVLTLTAI